jgi:hypothetical protein
MTSFVHELTRTYTAFADRNVFLYLRHSAVQRLISLYEQGYSPGVAIVIEAYKEALSDSRRDVEHTIPVTVSLSGVPHSFLVVCQLSKMCFDVTMITPNEQ